jgi:hypothetical protein
MQCCVILSVAVFLYICICMQCHGDITTVTTTTIIFSIILYECYVNLDQNNLLLSLPPFDRNKLFCIQKCTVNCYQHALS